MKRSALLFSTIILYTCCQAQNPTVIEKGAPQSNNTLPSAGALGSNSGVNPGGNPGTIAGYSGNSNSINTIATPNPNVEPGVTLSSAPEGTVTNTTVTNGANVQHYTSVTVNGSTVTTSVETATKPVVVSENPRTAPAPNPNPPVATNNATPPMPAIANPGTKTTLDVATSDKNVIAPDRSTASREKSEKIGRNKKADRRAIVQNNEVVKEKGLPAYSPVVRNFVTPDVISKIKAKYGSSVYDVKEVRVAQTNKIAYLVRLFENGKVSSALFYDEK